ncbi:hypothetical protein XU18_2766 [Perkinsela sp. CCAP 1560/4]|nr:hypothetical protein XU18_2766 [Perkinsela sp. CCAP 1560/4]|eukprot:KNH06261.1 hypothetical protein XU18_2766 [Perkinsela sp. CCAP 1560/4]
MKQGLRPLATWVKFLFYTESRPIRPLHVMPHVISRHAMDSFYCSRVYSRGRLSCSVELNVSSPKEYTTLSASASHSVFYGHVDTMAPRFSDSGFACIVIFALMQIRVPGDQAGNHTHTQAMGPFKYPRDSFSLSISL